MSKLKPCPFCGASGISVHLSRERYETEKIWQYQVICNYNLGGCGASACYSGTEIDAINAWNRRATQG